MDPDEAAARHPGMVRCITAVSGLGFSFLVTFTVIYAATYYRAYRASFTKQASLGSSSIETEDSSSKSTVIPPDQGFHHDFMHGVGNDESNHSLFPYFREYSAYEKSGDASIAIRPLFSRKTFFPETISVPHFNDAAFAENSRPDFFHKASDLNR